MRRDPRFVIGPRNRRRLVAVVAVLGVLAAIAVGVGLLTRPSNHSGSNSTLRAALAVNATVNLTYGMTHKQVEQVTGKPTIVRGNCSLFRPKDGKVGSLSMGLPGTPAAKSEGDLKLCFYGGLYTSATRYTLLNGKWVWTEWVSRLILMKPGATPSVVGG